MQWSKQHDILLAKEIVAMEACDHKKGSNKIGKIWTDIAVSLEVMKVKRKMEKVTAEDIKKMALERMGQTKKRKEDVKNIHQSQRETEEMDLMQLNF